MTVGVIVLMNYILLAHGRTGVWRESEVWQVRESTTIGGAASVMESMVVHAIIGSMM